APELALSYGFAEAASDIYSLALVFGERVSGVPAEQLRAAEGRAPTREQLAERWTQLPPAVIEVLAELFQRTLGPGQMAPAGADAAERPAPNWCAARLRTATRLLRGAEAEQAGALLDGRYQVRRKLGEGASGKTYLVEDTEIEPSLPRAFVVKASPPPAPALARARRESVALRAAHSPYLPRLYDFSPPQQDVHLKMDYVPGQPLAALRSEFPWNEARWWRFADGLLSALDALER